MDRRVTMAGVLSLTLGVVCGSSTVGVRSRLDRQSRPDSTSATTIPSSDAEHVRQAADALQGLVGAVLTVRLVRWAG
jgi:hypothetical protein